VLHLETPWAVAAVPDFAFPETEGQRPPDLVDMLKFRRALNRLAAADPAVHQQMIDQPARFGEEGRREPLPPIG
jgi:hypothetical protein